MSIDFRGHPAAFKKVIEESGEETSYPAEISEHGSQLLPAPGREVPVKAFRVYGLKHQTSVDHVRTLLGVRGGGRRPFPESSGMQRLPFSRPVAGAKAFKAALEEGVAESRIQNQEPGKPIGEGDWDHTDPPFFR
jgi:hypothetical protein